VNTQEKVAWFKAAAQLGDGVAMVQTIAEIIGEKDWRDIPADGEMIAMRLALALPEDDFVEVLEITCRHLGMIE
jgi:hypothetical protein